MVTQSRVSLTSSAHSSDAALQQGPVQALMDNHRRSLVQCAALHTLARHLLAHGNDAPAQSAAHDLLEYFDITVRISQDAEERILFPAFIESMAGSDAVCLRGITEGLTDMIHAVQRRWMLQLRAPLLRIAEGSAASLPPADLEAFSDEYAAYTGRCDTELLPMVERLLGDAELRLLEQALRAPGTRN